jgi:hypothetical protein
MGAIKNVKTWACRRTDLRDVDCNQPEPTFEYFHVYIRLPIYPSLLLRDLRVTSGRWVSQFAV